MALVTAPREEYVLRTRTLVARHAPSPGRPSAVYIHGLGGSSLNWADFMVLMQPHVDG